MDYCSGASILVRRDVFLDMGGFDERYAPAYCEDSDLSFRLRRMGLRTYYQPRSEVVHFEGVSHGRDVRHGVKAYQIANQATFREVWAAELARDHFPNGTHVLRARERARLRRMVLIVDHFVPEPDRDAGSRTMLAFVRALLADGCVVKFWPFNLHPTPGYTQALQDLGVEVAHGPGAPSLAEWMRRHGGDLDLVLLSRPDVAEVCLPAVRRGTRAPVAYYGHDLHFRRMTDQARLPGVAPAARQAGLRAAEVMRARELLIWRACDRVLYPSEDEAAAVRALVPAADVRAVVAYALGGEDAAVARPGPPAGRTILFVAGFGHPPNAEGALWFARAVLPLVLARVPDARLAIVGSNPPPEVAALAGPAVTLAANVTDAELAGFYAAARVAVVPLLAGAGVKRKTVEALWHGLPAVVTPVGAQGLSGLGDVAAVEAGDAGFADAVCALLEDDALWRRRSAMQAAYARTRFSDAALARSLGDALDFGETDAGGFYSMPGSDRAIVPVREAA